MKPLVLIFALATCGFASSFKEAHTASDLTTAQTCNSQSTQGTFAPQKMMTAGSPATGTWAFTQAVSLSRTFEFYSDANFPNQTSWASGNYVVSLNVTVANGAGTMQWTATCILRVNSSGVSQATVGSLTAQTTTFSTTGVKTHTVSGSAQASASATDRICVVMVFTSSTGASKSWTLDGGGASDTVTTPIVVQFTAADAATTLSTESVTPVHGLVRSDSATTLSSETPSRVLATLRSDSATTLSSASLARVINFPRAASDSSLSESVSLSPIARNRTMSDSGVVTPSVSPSLALLRSAANSTLSATTLGRLVAVLRSASDGSLSVSVATIYQPGSVLYTRDLTVSAPAAAALDRLLASSRTTSDTSLTSQSLARDAILFTRTTSDAGLSTITVTRLTPFTRTASESTFSSVTVVRGGTDTYFRTISVSPSPLPVLGRSLSSDRRVSDSTLTVLVLSRIASYPRTLTLDASIATSPTKLRSVTRDQNDTTLNATAIDRLLALDRSLSTFSLSSVVLNVSNGMTQMLTRDLTDDLTVLVSLATQAGFNRDLSNSTSISPIPIRTIALNRLLNVTSVNTPVLSRASTFSRDLAFSLPITFTIDSVKGLQLPAMYQAIYPTQITDTPYPRLIFTVPYPKQRTDGVVK